MAHNDLFKIFFDALPIMLTFLLLFFTETLATTQNQKVRKQIPENLIMPIKEVQNLTIVMMNHRVVQKLFIQMVIVMICHRHRYQRLHRPTIVNRRHVLKVQNHRKNLYLMQLVQGTNKKVSYHISNIYEFNIQKK